MSVRILDISKSFGDLEVFSGLSLDLTENAVTAVLGPSGCGKTTLLNLIGGILAPDSGSITGMEDKVLSYLFQEPRLIPWKTVEGNLDFVLKPVIPPEAERKALIRETLATVDLLPFRSYLPGALSGGMRQRVGIARAFAYPSNMILMDEPFQALDLSLRLSLAEVFNTLWLKESRTAVFVTHDIHEALMLGDDIVVLSIRPARIERVFRNPLARAERRLDRDEILGLEKELYALLTKEYPVFENLEL
jgi:NitT/TauT family transport system ATP-binding protein